MSLLFTSLLILLACESDPTRGLCYPKHIDPMTKCQGSNTSFQECRYYFRATGMPDQSWCRGIQQNSRQYTELPECDFSTPNSWGKVSCTPYGLDSALLCFGCSVNRPEAAQTYIYAYDEACSTGIEQVTCNIPPLTVKDLIE